MDTIRFLRITAARVINFFHSQEKGSCHAPYEEQWSHKPQFCIAIPSQFHKDKYNNLSLFCSASSSFEIRFNWLQSTIALLNRISWFPTTVTLMILWWGFLYTHCRPSNVYFFFSFLFFFKFFCCTKFKIALSGKQWSLAVKTFP